mgnify:CR=1 FL=1
MCGLGLALRILPRLLRILAGLLPLLGRLPLLLLWIELFWLWRRCCLPLLRGNLALWGEVLSVLGVLPRLRHRLLGEGDWVCAWRRHGL